MFRRIDHVSIIIRMSIDSYLLNDIVVPKKQCGQSN